MFMSIDNLTIAISSAISAGKEILKIYNDPSADFEVERKADNSPLTIADRCSNNVIVPCLESSGIPVMSEETLNAEYGVRKEWDRLWIVDPLDGTKEFIKRNGDFTVNIALIENGEPVLGVIYVPVTDTLYFGEKNMGAYKTDNVSGKDFSSVHDLKALSLRMPFAKTDVFTIIASRSHMSAETSTYLEKMKKLHSDINIVSRGSSLKICLVAEGSADVYPRFAPTMEWDTAAGDAIARAAGKMIYLEDEKTPLSYNRENLTNPFFIVK